MRKQSLSSLSLSSLSLSLSLLGVAVVLPGSLAGCGDEGGEGEGEEGEGEGGEGEGEGEEGEGEGEGEGEAPPPDCSGGDAVLGSATVGAGFVVVDSAVAPEETADWAALATVHDDVAGDRVLRLAKDMSVSELGAWPTLALSDAIDAQLAPPDFAPEPSGFVSGYLLATATHLVAGFTAIDGTVVVHTRAGDGGDNVFLDGPGNFDATLVGGRVAMSGLGLGVTSGADIYGLDDLVTPTASALLSFGAGRVSSHVATIGVAGGGAGDIVVLGTAAAPDFVNQYFAFDAAVVEAAFVGTPLVAPAAPVLERGAVGGIKGFAGGLAVVEGFPGFGASGLDHVALTRDEAGVYTAAAAVDLLDVDDVCTKLGPITTIDNVDGSDDLLVTLVQRDVADRVVRLHKQ